MKRPQNFDELLDIAKKRPDVHGALSQLGVSLKRVGRSMGGIRWQTKTKGGTSGDLSAIAFIEKVDGSWVICDNKGRTGQQFIDSITLLREIFGVSFDDAVYMLSGGRPSAPIATPKPLTLERKAEPREERTYTPPTPAPDKLRNVKAYLIQTRKLPKELVLPLIDSGKIYASERFKNKIAFCTFPITDENENNVGTDMAATIDVTHQDNVGGHVVHHENEDVYPKKENGALDKGASGEILKQEKYQEYQSFDANEEILQMVSNVNKENFKRELSGYYISENPAPRCDKNAKMNNKPLSKKL